jgi:hypothetical protein
MEASGSEVTASRRHRETSTLLAVGDREQDGVGAATVITIGVRCPRTYLARLAQAPVVIRRALSPTPSAQQPTASSVDAFSCAPRPTDARDRRAGRRVPCGTGYAPGSRELPG